MPRMKNLTLATARLWSPWLPSQLGEQVGESHKAEEAGSEDPLLWGGRVNPSLVPSWERACGWGCSLTLGFLRSGT